jgi:biotin carboxylase
MPFVIFAAPILSDNAFRMVEAAAGLPDVQLAVITQDGEDRLLGLRGHVRHWQVADILDVEQLAWAAEGLARQFGPIHRLFGAFEQIQVQLAEVRARLGIEGMGVEAAHNFRDKARMKTLLRAAGLPCARHCLASTLDEAVAFAEANGFPVVVKPPAGAGAIATFRVDNMQSLIAALSRTPPTAEHPVLLEEFVQGEEHSFETMTVNGEHVWHSLTHYYPTPLTVLENPWIQWSLVLPREVDGTQYDDIRSAARRALDVLGMHTGISHMEWFRRRDGTIAISEVAARPPGAQITQLRSYAHDFDLVQ